VKDAVTVVAAATVTVQVLPELEVQPVQVVKVEPVSGVVVRVRVSVGAKAAWVVVQPSGQEMAVSMVVS